MVIVLPLLTPGGPVAVAGGEGEIVRFALIASISAISLRLAISFMAALLPPLPLLLMADPFILIARLLTIFEIGALSCMADSLLLGLLM
ncbi:hypothetical protein Dimus_038977 [Dionaea muscipula]